MGDPVISAPQSRQAPESAAASAAWYRLLLGPLAPAGSRARLTILIFHRVHLQTDPLFPGEMDAAAFRARMQWVRAWFNVLPLDEAVHALERGVLPARAAAISFDDGYADNIQVAFPILCDLGLPATFFIATGFLDGGRMWNDTVIESVRRASGADLDLASLGLGRHAIGSIELRRAAIASLLSQLKYRSVAERLDLSDAIAEKANATALPDLMMSSADVRALAAAGMGIGAHTVSHPILARLPDDEARREIGDGRDALAAIVRRPVTLFAYPNGKPSQDYTAAHVRMAREFGFSAAVSTAWGAARHGDSMFELPRFTPWDRSAAGWAGRFARNYFASTERAAA